MDSLWVVVEIGAPLCTSANTTHAVAWNPSACGAVNARAMVAANLPRAQGFGKCPTRKKTIGIGSCIAECGGCDALC